MDKGNGQDLMKDTPDVNVDTIGQGGRNVDGVGYVVNTLSEDQTRNGSSKTDVPTYNE